MDSNFENIDDIKNSGFLGFKTVRQLMLVPSPVPKIRGVYLVITENRGEVKYLSNGTGGFFKGNNPNISIEELNNNWIDNCLVVYIGKAGSETGSATLYSRLRQYLNFGQGKNVDHWGGRLIWQLEHSSSLLLCWKPLPDQEPRLIEKQLIQRFVTQYSRLPFANLTG